MSWNYNNFGYNHNPLENSNSSMRNTTRMEETPSSIMDELYRERDKMLAVLNSSFKSNSTPCRDPPLPPPQYHTYFDYPSPPYSSTYHEPYHHPYPSSYQTSYQTSSYEPSPPPHRPYKEPYSSLLPCPPPYHHSYQTTYQPPPREPSPPPKPITRKQNPLDAFFDYPNMDDHTKELKRMYAVNKTRSLQLYRKKTACGLSKQLDRKSVV